MEGTAWVLEVFELSIQAALQCEGRFGASIC